MNRPKREFVNVDELSRRVSVEQVLGHFGLAQEIAQRVGDEIRTRCFLNCGKTEPTGDRVLAIQNQDVKRWCCHRYECPHKAGGNLVGLVDLLLPGTNGNGRPRGDRFKEVLGTLQQIAGETAQPAPSVAEKPAAPEPIPLNVPLAESSNERARGLVNLHEKFIIDPATMNPSAASYFRRRTYLTPEACAAWKVGYLAQDSGGDKSGGTMRGKVVYPVHDTQGRVLTWFGRDPRYEERLAAWQKSDRSERTPEKFHFVKGYHRGLELFGQHRLAEQETREAVQALGHLLIVEGPNDALRLSALGVPAVAACSNHLTREQADKIATWCRELDVAAGLLFDLDPEGESGMQQALWELAQRVPTRLVWSRETLGGRFKDRQPENLSDTEWTAIRDRLRCGDTPGE